MESEPVQQSQPLSASAQNGKLGDGKRRPKPKQKDRAYLSIQIASVQLKERSHHFIIQL